MGRWVIGKRGKTGLTCELKESEREGEMGERDAGTMVQKVIEHNKAERPSTSMQPAPRDQVQSNHQPANQPHMPPPSYLSPSFSRFFLYRPTECNGRENHSTNLSQTDAAAHDNSTWRDHASLAYGLRDPPSAAPRASCSTAGCNLGRERGPILCVNGCQWM